MVTHPSARMESDSDSWLVSPVTRVTEHLNASPLKKKQDSNYQQLHRGMPYNHPNFNPKRNRWQTFSNLNRPCHLGILPSITQKNNDIFFSQAASVQSVMLASTRKASQRLRIESRRSVSYPSWTVSLHNLKSSFVSPTGNIKRWRSLNFKKKAMINIYIYIYLYMYIYIVVNHSFYIITVYIYITHSNLPISIPPKKHMSLPTKPPQIGPTTPPVRVRARPRPLGPNVPRRLPARHAAAPWTNPSPNVPGPQK